MDFTPAEHGEDEKTEAGGEGMEGVPVPGGSDFRTPRKSIDVKNKNYDDDEEVLLEMVQVRSSPDDVDDGTDPAAPSPVRIDPRTGYAGLGPGFNGVATPKKEGAAVNVLGVDLSVHEDGSEAGEFSDDSAAAMDVGVDTPSVVAGSTPTRGETRVARRVFAVVSEPNNALHFLLFLLMGASMAVTDTFLFLWL